MELSPSIDDFDKKILHEGKGEIPVFREGSKVTFHFQTFTLDENGDAADSIDDSKSVGRPMEMILGKQFKMPVWESCLQTMKIGEVSAFTVKKSLVDAYPLVSRSYREFAGVSKGPTGHCCGMKVFAEGVGHKELDELIKLPRDLQFRLELLKAELPGEYTKEAWSMEPAEKLQTIPQLKELGNQLYKKQQFEDAAKKYAEALGMLEQLFLREKPGDKEWLQLEKLKMPILCNYAQCKLLQKDYYAVIEYTNTILEKDKNNVKALFRRGKAYVGTWDLDLAREDFNKVLELDPSFQSVIQKELANVNKLQKQKDDEIKSKLFGKGFSE